MLELTYMEPQLIKFVYFLSTHVIFLIKHVTLHIIKYELCEPIIIP